MGSRWGIDRGTCVSRGWSILEWACAGFAALALIGALPGCERTIGDEGNRNGPTPTPGIAIPTPIPCEPEAPDGGCV